MLTIIMYRKILNENGKTIILVFSGLIMVAHGSRMIYQGVFNKGSYYIPNQFDIFFDWTTLAVLGLIIFYFGISGFYQKIQIKN